MPIRRDIHRAREAADLADKAPADARPRLILGKRVEPNIYHAPIALTAETLNRTGDMPVGKPFCRTARRVVARPSRVSPPLSHCG
jgi:hypothetical protein